MRRLDVPAVVGAGPAGLSVGYALSRYGVRAKLFDRGDKVGYAWRTYYDTLRLNSPRVLSSLPGMTIDPGAGRYPSRIDFILYLERYARRWDLDVEFGVETNRIDRADDGGWILRTSKGDIWAPQVIVATGLYANPEIPPWPGRESFTKDLLHVRDYRSAKPYAGKSVLVVGAGQSGSDVAMEAVAVGAKRVWLSVRTPPHISRPDILGMSPSTMAFVIKASPQWVEPAVDVWTKFFQRILQLQLGDMSKYGLPAPKEGLATALKSRGRGILVDRGIITAIRAGQVEVVPAVESLDGDDVVCAGGSRVSPDVVVAGTGARTNLAQLVGHLDVLDVDDRPLGQGGAGAPGAPGMFFIGYRLPPGVLPDARRDAPAIARKIMGRRALPLPAWRTSVTGYPPGKEPALPDIDITAANSEYQVSRGDAVATRL